MLPLLIPVIAQLAPSLIDWLFGPKAADATTKVVDVVKAVTGADPTTAEGAAVVQAMIAGKPDVALDLQAKLMALKATMQAEADREADAARQAEVDAMKASIADIASARARDVALKAGGGHNYQANAMLIVVCLVLLSCIISASTGRLNDIALGMVVSLSGVMAGCFKDAFGFEFGSSRQSEMKSQTIAGLAQSAQTALANSTPVR